MELTRPDVELKVCDQAPHGFYAFGCPDCVRTITRPADERGGARGSRPLRDSIGPVVARLGGPRLPTALVVALALFALAVAVTVAFTVWRLLANLKALGAAVANLGAQLTPALEDLATRSQEAAERAARLQARGARAAGPKDARAAGP